MAIVVGPTQWQCNVKLNAQFELYGGALICQSGGVNWIVAPASTEVSRSWFCRNDAVTTAQAYAACGDWFVPSLSQLQNPGYCCRSYWDSYSLAEYYTSTSLDINGAYTVNFINGNNSYGLKWEACCVRAFRCVTY